MQGRQDITERVNKETGQGSVLIEDDLLNMTCLIKEQKAADMKDITNHAQHAIAAEVVGETDTGKSG